MPTRSRTLRKLPAFTRKYYRLCDELQSICTRLKNLREDIQRMELESRALFESQKKLSDAGLQDFPDPRDTDPEGVN